MADESLTAELRALIGDDDFIRLTERHGGTRLYMPARAQDTAIAGLDPKSLANLRDRFGGSYIRVPLAREIRARHYRQTAMSNAQIARRLGITETGVDKLFARMDNPPVKGSDPRQADLFAQS